MRGMRMAMAGWALVVGAAMGAAGCANSGRVPPRDEALQLRLAELEAQLARTQAAPAPTSTDERLARVEAQLALIVARLEQREPASAPAAPKDSAPAPAAPLVRPEQAVEFKGFSMMERALVGGLEKRFTEGKKTKVGHQREELLGKPLPQTRFIGAGGEVVDLADFTGSKRVVLVVMRGFSGSVCIGCSVQTAVLADSVEEFTRRNAQVVLVYPGAAEAVPTFVEAVKSVSDNGPVPFPVLLDVSLGAVNGLGIQGALAKPTSIILDEQGVVRYAYVGESYNDRPSVAELTEALDALKP